MLVLSRVTRPRADVREAERLKELANRVVIGDPEALKNNALQVDPAPAHDAMHGPVRAGLNELCDLGALLRREARLRTLGPAVPKAIGAVRVEPVNPATASEKKPYKMTFFGLCRRLP